MTSDNRRLREERATCLTELQALSNKEKLTKEDRVAFEHGLNRADALKRQIDEAEGDGMFAFRGGQPGGASAARSAEDSPEVRSAFANYLRRGRGELSGAERAALRWDGEQRDMGTGGGNALQGTGGGFFVPVGFVQDVEQALKYYGPMLNGGVGDPHIMETATGQSLPYPTSNDTGVVGELLAEGSPVGTADVNLSSVIFGAYKISSKLVKVSIELMEDSAFPLENFLKAQFAERIGRVVNSYATTGTGNNQPQGIVTAALAGGLTVTSVGSGTNDGTGVAGTSIGSDDLVNLEHTVDPLYRPNAKFMMHDTTLRQLKHLEDKYGRPLWMESTRDGQPATINGYPYLINNYMDQMPSSANSPVQTRNTVLFGQMSKFVLRVVKNLSVLRLSERFADYGQVAFIGFYRYDSKLLDAGTHPIAVLQNIF
jgi:HK97 family phage major capsid protein